MLNRDKKVLEKVIFRCAKIKALVVEADEKETKGIRTILNFGHTFAHAIEAASAYSKKYSHGQAVAIGMLMASDLATSLKICSNNITKRLENLIKRAGLPTYVKSLKLKEILFSLQHDKKFIRGKTRLVLPITIGKVKVFEGIEFKKIKKACLSRIKK